MKPPFTSALPSSSFTLLCALIASASGAPVWAQDPTTPPSADVSTTEAPASETTVTEVENGAEHPEVPTVTATPAAEAAGNTDAEKTDEAKSNLSKLNAEKITYDGSVIIGEGTPEKPVRFESSAGTITAQYVRLDVEKQTAEAKGEVVLERKTKIVRQQLRPRKLPDVEIEEFFTETARGQNLTFDFKNKTGNLDAARVELSQVSIDASQLFINGERYTAKNVVVRPGGLSPEEIKIYGTPPFNLRAREVTAITSTTPGNERLLVKGGSLYFKSTRLFPIPSYAFKVGGRESDPTAPSLTPKISFNSADRIFVATELVFPIDKAKPGRLDLATDLGLSQRVDFRGGASLRSEQGFGNLALSLRRSDVVSTQLTNRIELDRKPEISFDSKPFLAFDLPGNRRGGFTVDASYGDYTERSIGSNQNRVSSTRAFARFNFTTRLRPRDNISKGGPYLRLFSSYASYGITDSSYTSRGYEVGYDGQFLPKLHGQISLRRTNINGETPFRFDRIEIAKEVRATMDYAFTPRYLIPIDLRYDLDRQTLRDHSIGVLRSYKTFAYGLIYQAARNDLRLEVRQGF